ncbi:hypothetical protein A2U01_0051547, partial [Trifolium medium]|nr:hypothetical protein [Trifolium medium]
MLLQRPNTTFFGEYAEGNEDEWHVLFSCNYSTQAIQTAGLDHIVTPR